ncbi:hypothetical protein DB31_4709 [Hyalangium minutum]|uniref:Uncharacterized protein n=1 Tax=Hyalangium minutum TaxID=394096 RepID=A0A085VZD3_9BACT|nr:hypothetical protein DB31_4709 [Hyalangium minutum]
MHEGDDSCARERAPYVLSILAKAEQRDSPPRVRRILRS